MVAKMIHDILKDAAEFAWSEGLLVTHAEISSMLKRLSAEGGELNENTADLVDFDRWRIARGLDVGA